MSDYALRGQRNSASKVGAENDGQNWSDGDLELLQRWDRSEKTLPALSELLLRTIEACREQYYHRRRSGVWGAAPPVPSRPACPHCWPVHGTAQEDC